MSSAPASEAVAATAALLFSPASVAALLVALAFAYVVLEQLSFGATAPQLPSPAGWFVPVIGSIVAMVRDPYTYWEAQRRLAPAGVSKFYLLGKTVFFSTDTDTSRRILMHNGPDSLQMAVHPNAKWILGKNNLAFMHGPEHKALRKSVLSLFTAKALAVYVTAQDAVLQQHIARWLADPALTGEGRFGEVRNLIRDMNQETSQQVFVGPYLPDSDRAEFGAHYRNMTDGFLALPLLVPGTAVWRGMQSRKAVIRMLVKCAAASRRRLASGGAPACLLDFWVEHLAGEERACAAEGRPPPPHAADASIADVVMDFLFASQDASTASLTWVAALMCDHPGVAARVRAEALAVAPSMAAPGGPPLDGESLYAMTYTRQVVKETLRYRPAAPMIPMQVAAPGGFALADAVHAPRGALVIPSLTAAVWSGQGAADSSEFDPDRMSAERGEEAAHAKHFLTFGAGPHACLGYQYAINHLCAFAARLAVSVDMERRRDGESDKMVYLPTLYPANCMLHMQPAGAGVQKGG